MEDCSNYNMHMLVSSDGKELALRATLMYDESYLIVPVLEEECMPWNKQRFEEVTHAIMTASMWS
jgi:hypothetical protein